ncbi:hypothetical protein BT93_C1378 [Corymbia citriodora subsp. variegata]|nr:hypothetical protein BT93_C1378 [Corymbia citriodora subsp. variegata]
MALQVNISSDCSRNEWPWVRAPLPLGNSYQFFEESHKMMLAFYLLCPLFPPNSLVLVCFFYELETTLVQLLRRILRCTRISLSTLTKRTFTIVSGILCMLCTIPLP